MWRQWRKAQAQSVNPAPFCAASRWADLIIAIVRAIAWCGPIYHHDLRSTDPLSYSIACRHVSSCLRMHSRFPTRPRSQRPISHPANPTIFPARYAYSSSSTCREASQEDIRFLPYRRWGRADGMPRVSGPTGHCHDGDVGQESGRAACGQPGESKGRRSEETKEQGAEGGQEGAVVWDDVKETRLRGCLGAFRGSADHWPSIWSSSLRH